jgi:hypothetical protein
MSYELLTNLITVSNIEAIENESCCLILTKKIIIRIILLRFNFVLQHCTLPCGVRPSAWGVYFAWRGWRVCSSFLLQIRQIGASDLVKSKGSFFYKCPRLIVRLILCNRKSKRWRAGEGSWPQLISSRYNLIVIVKRIFSCDSSPRYRSPLPNTRDIYVEDFVSHDLFGGFPPAYMNECVTRGYCVVFKSPWNRWKFKAQPLADAAVNNATNWIRELSHRSQKALHQPLATCHSRWKLKTSSRRNAIRSHPSYTFPSAKKYIFSISKFYGLFSSRARGRLKGTVCPMRIILSFDLFLRYPEIFHIW